LKLGSALIRLVGADAVVLQSIVCEELAHGPYTVTVSDEARTVHSMLQAERSNRNATVPHK